jgi:hypothetical protein
MLISESANYENASSMSKMFFGTSTSTKLYVRALQGNLR